MSRPWLRASFVSLCFGACGADADLESADAKIEAADAGSESVDTARDTTKPIEAAPGADAGCITDAERSSRTMIDIGGNVPRGSDDTIACGAPTRGNGKLITETREVGDFGGIRISDVLQGTLAIGPSALRLTIDENLLARIETRVRDGVLHIGNVDPRTSLLPSAESHVDVAAPQLTRLSAHGAAGLRGAAAGPTMAVEATGSAKLELALQVAGAVTASASGASRILVTGAAAKLVLDASGSAQLQSALATADVEVEASGAAQVEVRATRSVRIVASGAATVRVLGEPMQRSVEKRGTATVVFAK